MEKKKYTSVTMLRVFSMFLILLYHFIFKCESANTYSFTDHGIRYLGAHFNIATLAVALFFMASGFGLYLSQQRKPLSPGKFYLRRFMVILIPYYLAVILGYLLYWWNGALPALTFSPLKLLFTAAGMDGYLASKGIETLYIGVGEWFVGVIVMCYLVFPFLYMIVRKKPYLCFFVMTALYFIRSILLIRSGKSPYTDPFCKLYDMFLGMYLAEFRDYSKKWMLIPCAAISLFLYFYTGDTPTEGWLDIEVFAAAVFIAFLALENLFSRFKTLNAAFDYLGGISYEVFLIHHVILELIFFRLLSVITPGSTKDTIQLFICWIVIVVFSGQCLVWIKKAIMRIPRMIFRKPEMNAGKE